MRHCFRLLLVINIVVVLFSTGCKSKNDVVAPVRDSLGKINQWIYDSMRYYYYWSSTMPAQPDYSLAPQLFFTSLQHKDDRFSSITNRADIGGKKSTFSYYGFHYSIVRHSVSGAYIGVVTYAAAETPAYRAGLRRGVYFTAVDDSTLSAESITWANERLSSGKTVSITPATWQNNAWVKEEPVSFASSYIDENPVVLTKYFSHNGVKTGYLFYNHFVEGYDVLLLDAFAKLKQENVQECIIDLRYNPGGSVASCAKMLGMLTTVTENSVFGIFVGNAGWARQVYNMSRILKTSTSASGATVPELAAHRLNLKRVFILTSRATASAAELLVNNLKPYLPVVQLGDTTMGKDEAGFQVADPRNPRQVEWVLQVIVYKLLNSAGNGSYHTGIVPARLVSELSAFPLAAIGAADDPLIAEALMQIYGSHTIEEGLLRRKKTPVYPVYVSSGADAAGAPVVQIDRPH